VGAADTYEYAPDEVARALRAFAGLPALCWRTALAAKMLDWVDSGMDFTDALHLAKAEGCEAFISFARRFTAAASPLGAVKVCAFRSCLNACAAEGAQRVSK